jgi:hypothetical protein
MRRVALMLLAFTALAAAPGLGAQEVQQQGKALTFPAYSADQRWNRTAEHFYAFFIAGIAHAKSLGKTPEQYGRFIGDLVAPSWGRPGSGSAIGVSRGWVYNFEAMPRGDAEASAVNDTLVVLRYRRTYVPFFGPTRSAFGVTLDEYERAFVALGTRINEYLGLHTRFRVDGDFHVVTISGRGKAVGAATFPTGTYTISFSADAVQKDPDLGAAWEITYTPNGHLTLRKNGATLLENDYEITFDQFTLLHADARTDGVNGCTTPATYRWRFDSQTQRLTLVPLVDECAARADWISKAITMRKGP